MRRDRQSKHRYILAIEGNDAPSVLFWIAASNSVALCGPHRWETIMDFGLEPFGHLVPVSEDVADIEARIDPLEQNPAIVPENVINAQAFLRVATDSQLRSIIDMECFRRITNRQIGAFRELMRSSAL